MKEVTDDFETMFQTIKQPISNKASDLDKVRDVTLKIQPNQWKFRSLSSFLEYHLDKVVHTTIEHWTKLAEKLQLNGTVSKEFITELSYMAYAEVTLKYDFTCQNLTLISPLANETNSSILDSPNNHETMITSSPNIVTKLEQVVTPEIVDFILCGTPICIHPSSSPHRVDKDTHFESSLYLTIPQFCEFIKIPGLDQTIFNYLKVAKPMNPFTNRLKFIADAIDFCFQPQFHSTLHLRSETFDLASIKQGQYLIARRKFNSDLAKTLTPSYLNDYKPVISFQNLETKISGKELIWYGTDQTSALNTHLI